MSRGHKVLNTWFKNRQTQQNFATGKSEIPTPAERKAQLEKQQDKKIKVDEAIDKEHPIYKEYQALKKHDIKSLRNIIKGQHRIIDTSEFRTKEHAVSHILHTKHGSKRMAAVFGESLELDEANKSKPVAMSHTVYDAHDREERQVRHLVHGTEGGVQSAKKSYKHAQTVGVREDMDITQTFFSLIEGWETEKKKRHLRDALDRHSQKAIEANRAGDHDAVKVHQSYMNKIKGQMEKLARNESIEDIWDTSEFQIEAINVDMVNKTDKLRQAGAKEMSIKDKLLSIPRGFKAMKAGKSEVDAKLKEETELDEAWNKGNRNPQRGIKVGHKVRSYDFPGMHDSHYIEGHVVGETPNSYHIKVSRVVRDNKEIPTPAHMHHVEAPKGKSIWTDAYAVHKVNNKLQTEQAVAPVEKNYYKGVRLHFAKGNRGGKSSSNKGGAADGGNGGGSGGGNGGGSGDA